jgi:hypothetical protein
MSEPSELYPPAPTSVPTDLTSPSREYRFRVVVVLICLLVFVAVYLALTVGSAYVCYCCLSDGDDPPPPAQAPGLQAGPKPNRSDTPQFLSAVGGVFTALFCLVMLKGLFTRGQSEHESRLEVSEEEQPVLFGFVRRLCQEIGAPFPPHIYLVPQAVASSAVRESFVSLLFPSPANLDIGLGLVNRLNLSEFKAVLAFQLSQFGKDGAKLWSYTYAANRVIWKIVYGRDWLDDLLDTLRGIYLIGMLVWAFSAILSVMRTGLALLYRALNVSYGSLARQMVYNADLVAASAAGSDALVFVLLRSEFASDTFDQAWTDLYAAADHGRYTRDLYYHQTRAAEFLRIKRNDPSLGTVPPLPDDPTQTVQVFEPKDTGTPRPRATHPSNYDREVNAKRRYVRGSVDERSPWMLFHRAEAVREAATRQLYTAAGRTLPAALEEPALVQAFIDAEHAAMTYHPRYHGTYDGRYIRPGDLGILCAPAARAALDEPTQLAAAYAALYGADFKNRTSAQKTRHDEVAKLDRIVRGVEELTGAEFEHRGWWYPRRAAAGLLKNVEDEITRERARLDALDREVFRVHFAMALRLGMGDAGDLEWRYHFHLAAQHMHETLVRHANLVRGTVSGWGGTRQVSWRTFRYAVNVLADAHETLDAQLRSALGLQVPELVNIEEGVALSSFLLTKPLIRGLFRGASRIEGEWIDQLVKQLDEVIGQLARILWKSLGGLLALQERIAERWHAAHTAAPEPAAPTESTEDR